MPELIPSSFFFAATGGLLSKLSEQLNEPVLSELAQVAVKEGSRAASS
jgi:hypothetical protein